MTGLTGEENAAIAANTILTALTICCCHGEAFRISLLQRLETNLSYDGGAEDKILNAFIEYVND